MEFLAIPGGFAFCHVAVGLGQYLIGLAPHAVGFRVAVAAWWLFFGYRFRQLGDIPALFWRGVLVDTVAIRPWCAIIGSRSVAVASGPGCRGTSAKEG